MCTAQTQTDTLINSNFTKKLCKTCVGIVNRELALKSRNFVHSDESLIKKKPVYQEIFQINREERVDESHENQVKFKKHKNKANFEAKIIKTELAEEDRPYEKPD